MSLLPAIASGLRTNRLVTGITRAGTDKITTSGRSEAPFLITTEGPFGLERTLARAVIDATGTWLTPNPVGADGRPAIGERHAGDLIEVGIPDVLGRDRRRYAKRRVAVVGSGHSAQNAIRDLAVLAERSPGTQVTWIVRRSDAGQMFGGKANDQLPERGRLGADAQHVVDNGAVTLVSGFRTDRIVHGPDGATLVAVDGREAGPFDRIVNATGFRPDLEIVSELRVDVDPVLQSARTLGADDRPQRALVRVRPPARRGRARPPRTRLLHRRRQELRPGPDVPARHRLRTGPLRGRRARRRPRRRRGRATDPARDRSLLTRPLAHGRAATARAVRSGHGSGCGQRLLQLTTPSPGGGRSALRRATLTLAIAQLVSWGVLFYGFAVTAPEITDDTGWSDGVVAGAFSLGLLISGLRSTTDRPRPRQVRPAAGPHHRIDRRHARHARLRRRTTTQ